MLMVKVAVVVMIAVGIISSGDDGRWLWWW